ncbi:MAG: redox-regulated ATPase YchF [Deltaproteobacteria bacterium]|nr:redox-regulated ATPase YchF [Deltaproteobacteria bacterium]
MEIGIVGLSLSGKTTLFNLLTHSGAETGFGASRKKANLGVSRVPDPRLDKLSEMWNPKKTTPTTIRYVDVAGVEKSTGREGLSSETLAALKNTDALLAVVRGFEDEQVPHPEETLDPVRDVGMLQGEFLLSDLIIIENRLERLAKQIKTKGGKELEAEQELLLRCREALEAEKPLRDLELSSDDARALKGYQFLTQKPLVIAVNLGEADMAKPAEKVAPVTERWGGGQVAVTYLCATIEQEISELSPEDARAFLDDLGITESATDRIIRTSYDLLGLMSFFTMGEDECRAWTIRKGTKAPQAAGTIHTDLERGFIRAEVVRYDDFVAAGSLAACRDKGLLRLEGKEYVVHDGDVLNIRFSV